MRGTPGPRVSSLLASSTRYKVYGKEEDTTKVIPVETQKVSQPEPEERPPQSNKTQDASLPRDAVSALVFHICDIWKLWGADALSMSNDHLARELGLLHPPHQPPHVHEGRVGVLLGRCWDPPDGSGCAGRRKWKKFFSYFLFSSAGGIIVKFGVTKFNCCTKFPS